MIKRLLVAVAMLCAVSHAQVTVAPLLNPHQTFVDQSGAPCAGCSFYSYTAGTTIPSATYTDASGGVQNPNPIVLSVQGGANIWVDTSISYKFILKNPQGSTIWSVDNVRGLQGNILSNPSGAQTINQPGGTDMSVNTSGGGKFFYNNAEVLTGASPTINGIIFAQTGQSIATLCAGFSGAPGTVIISNATLIVSAATTIPQNCTIEVLQGGQLSVATGTTLTFNGPFVAGIYQALTLTGTASVVYGNQSVDGIRPQWYGAMANGSHDDSPAVQAAFDAAARSNVKRVLLAPGEYLMNEAIDATSSSTLSHSQLTVIGEGRRGGVHILANTGGILFDLSGAAWTSWRGMWIDTGPTNVSNAAFLMDSTNFGEGLYNAFDQVTIQLYKSTYSTSMGTVGFLICGSEENTYIGTQVYATTPIVMTTFYSDISGSYPSPFQHANILAAHSTGVNTFSGESSIVTFDAKGPNVWLDGANTVDFGNIYFSNINIGSPGLNQDVFYLSNGTEEAYRGQIKVESKSTLIHLHQGQLYAWNMSVAVGAGVDNTKPWINVDGSPSGTSIIGNSNITISYYTPSVFAGKALWNSSLTSGTARISNSNFSINQDIAQYTSSTWPAWALTTGVTNNSWLYLIDSSYPVNSAAIPTLFTVSYFYNNGANSATCSATGWFGLPIWDGTSNITFRGNGSSNAGSVSCTSLSAGIVLQNYDSTGGTDQTISMSSQFAQTGGHWVSVNGSRFAVSGANSIFLGLAGSGKALACLDASGQVYRGTTTTCP